MDTIENMIKKSTADLEKSRAVQHMIKATAQPIKGFKIPIHAHLEPDTHKRRADIAENAFNMYSLRPSGNGFRTPRKNDPMDVSYVEQAAIAAGMVTPPKRKRSKRGKQKQIAEEYFRAAFAANWRNHKGEVLLIMRELANPQISMEQGIQLAARLKELGTSVKEQVGHE